MNRIPPLKSTIIRSEEASFKLPFLSAPPKLVSANQMSRPLKKGPVKLSLNDIKALEMSFTPQKHSKKNQEKIKELLESIPNSIDHTMTPIQDIQDMTISLLPHQAEGLAWLKDREDSNKGCILADDMGLGKTVQSIALILTRPSDKNIHRPTLIIAPLALIRQWEAEIKSKVKPNVLKVQVYHGPQRKSVAHRLSQVDVVITTYNVLTSEMAVHDSDESQDDEFSSKIRPIQNSQGPIYSIHWHRIILDEAHTIRNRSTKAAKGCYLLKSTYRICLTGTPIQNSVEDLYSLVKFLRIEPYQDYSEFKSMITDPLTKKTSNPRDVEKCLKRLQLLNKAIMLRRTKAILTQLPIKIIETVSLSFSMKELNFYDSLKDTVKTQLKVMMQEKAKYTNVLLLLLRLRQACNHPALVGYEMNNEDQLNKKDLDSQLDDLADIFGSMGLQEDTLTCSSCMSLISSKSKDGLCPSCHVKEPLTPREKRLLYEKKKKTMIANLSSHWESSTKINKTLLVIKLHSQESKIIIFSQFTTMLDVISIPLAQEGITFARYDGAMDNKTREAQLEKFRLDSNCRILLISLKCGSMGLNLTVANVVILLDVWWNPAIEDQAIDRVHRIGQERPVKVYKFLVKETVEDNIVRLQGKKRDMIKNALEDPGFLKKGKLSMDELLSLF